MRKILFTVFILSICVFFAGCGVGKKTLTKTDFIFDTVITVTFYDGGDEGLLDEAFEKCRYYERLFSKTIEESDISRINSAKGERVKVDRETAGLVKTAIQYGDLSDGLFDITIGAATALWDFKAENPAPPSKEQTDSVLPLIDYHTIEVTKEGEEDYIRVPEGVILDLGGIAKGYVSDRLYAFLKDRGVKSGIVNLGGNISLLGGKNDTGNFAVGVRDPQGSQSDIAGKLSLQDTSVVSSGAYERGFDYEGVHYHHILDPKTGRSAVSDLSGVTIVTKNGVDADALSTICFLLGKDRGMALLNRIEGAEGVFISDSGAIETTPGLAGSFEK